MEGLDHSKLTLENCPISKSIAEIGNKWVLLLLREAFMGTRRFDEFQEHLGISKSVLSNKLKMMLNKNLLTKVDYKERNNRTRSEYQLTNKGKDLLEVVMSLLNWGNKYLVETNEETIFLVDNIEKKPVSLSYVNAKGEIIRRRDLLRISGTLEDLST